MNAPDFLELDGGAVVAAIKADYEAITGKFVQPGQAEMLIINALANREMVLRYQMQSTAEQQYVPFSTGIGLDNLGEFFGVYRLAPSPSQCTIRFVLVPDHTGVSIPEGLRVATSDGKAVFITKQPTNVLAGTTQVDIEAYCSVLGTIGNGYAAGVVKNILDPQSYLVSAANLATTTGGGDEEGDEALRARIRLAPSSFSVAGPTGAYKFHALAANVNVIDVAVTSPTPGTVEVFPLVGGGVVTPVEILNDVEEALNAETVRPLCDTVIVTSPTVVDYDIEVDLVVFTNADQTAITDAVELALADYAAERATHLGGDIVLEKIIQLCMIDGVYSVSVVSPATTTVIAATEVGNCTGVVVGVSSTTNG